MSSTVDQLAARLSNPDTAFDALSTIATEMNISTGDLCDKVFSSKMIFPGLAASPSEAMKKLPEYVTNLYGGQKKLKSSGEFYRKRIKDDDTVKTAPPHAFIAYDLVRGGYIQEILENEDLSLDLACLHSINHKILNRYSELYLKKSLPRLDEEIRNSHVLDFLPNGFTTVIGEIAWHAQLYRYMPSAYLLLDRAVHDLYLPEATKGEPDQKHIDAAQALYALSNVTRDTIQIKDIAERRNLPKISSCEEPHWLESYTDTKPLEDTSFLFAVTACLPSQSSNRMGAMAALVQDERIKPSLTSAGNRYFMGNAISTVCNLMKVSEQDLKKPMGSKDPIIEACARLGKATTKAINLQISCAHIFSRGRYFMVDDKTPDATADLVSETKKDLAQAAADVKGPGDLQRVQELGSVLEELLGHQEGRVSHFVSYLDDLTKEIAEEVRLHSKAAPAEQKEDVSQDDMIGYLENENVILDKENALLKEELNAASNKLAVLEAQPQQTAETDPADHAFPYILTGLKHSLSFPEFMESARKYYAPRLIIHPDAIKDAREYADHTRFKHVGDRLERLAGEFTDLIAEGGNLNDAAKKTLGNDYCTETSLKGASSKAVAQRTVKHDGKKVTCNQYLRIGRDFRIYFAPVKDGKKSKILVAYAGDKILKV